MSSSQRFLLLLLLLSSMRISSLVLGQDPQPPVAPAVVPAPVPAAPAPPREVNIYIPYTKLRSIFEKQGRGVFIPYEKFQELLKSAQQAQAKLETLKPPVGGLITAIESEATVGRDVVRVKAKLSIELLGEGWVRVPLRLADSSLRTATLGEAPARILTTDQGYELLYEKKSKDSETLELILEYSKAYAKTPGNNHVSFQAPQAAVNRWTIRIDQPDAKVTVRPQAATSDVKPMDADPAAPKPEAKQTVVETHLGVAPEISIDWTSKAEGAAGLAALATVQTRQEVSIEEGVARSRIMLNYDISRSELTQLTLEVPANFKVVNVFDTNVQKWEVAAKDEATQTITVQLFQGAKGSQALSLELERVDQNLLKNGVQVPAIKAVDAARQFGVVVVRVAPALRAEIEARSGLAQLDASELPPELAGQAWAFAFRYSTLPYELSLRLENVEPRIEATQFTELYLEPRQLAIDHLVSLNVERAGIFSATVTIPAGYEVQSVVGRAYADVQAVAVESFHVDDKDKTKLNVNFARKSLGKAAFVVRLLKRLDDANLLTPTGKNVAEKLQLPRFNHPALEQSHGYAVLYAPEALQVLAKDLEGLRAVASQEPLSLGLSVRDNKLPLLRETLPFAYAREAASLELEIQRRKPMVTVRQTLTALVESGVVNFTATFHYEIRYSGVKSLRIDVPTAIADKLHEEHATLKKVILAPQPADVAKGYQAIELLGEGELLGTVEVPFTWTENIGELQIGVPRKIVIPRLQPISDADSGATIDRAWGQIALAKAETIDLTVADDLHGLRPIDPQLDFLDRASFPNAERTFEFHDDTWSLTVAATRYELDQVKRTSIDRAVVRVIATRGGQLSVQALYRLRSARQRIAIALPPDVDPATAFDAQPLHINGQAVPLERDGTKFYAPLTSHKPDESLLLELRYTTVGTAGHIELPEFPDDPAVQKVFLIVYVPQERVVTGVHGAWNDEMSWRPPPSFVALGIVPPPPPSDTSDARLLRWVSEGISTASGAENRLQVDGQPRVFSTLRPAPGAAGALRLSVINRTTLNSITFLVMLLIGGVLLLRPACDRIAALGMLVAVVLLVAVFQPAFAAALLEGPLIIAVALVLLIWLVRYLAWLFTRNAWTGWQMPLMASPFAPRTTTAPSDSSSSSSSAATATPVAPTTPMPPVDDTPPPAPPTNGGAA